MRFAGDFFTKMQEAPTRKEGYTYIDLFCGAGGMSLGFDQAGFKNVFSVEFNPEICLTYKRNFPNHLLLNKDIKELTEEEILNLTKNNAVDVVIGGPPCQGFSLAGNIGRKFQDDPRNHLFKEFVRVVDIVKPKCFVMENVARMYTHKNGQTRREILECFRKIGYHVHCHVLNAADYGVPQIRSRIIFIGNRLSPFIEFPMPVVDKEHYKTVKDAIDRFPPIAYGGHSDIPNHEPMQHSAQMLEKMSYVKDGGNRNDIPEGLRPQKGDARKYIRYNSKEPSYCVTGDMRKIFHYNQNRALTVRELAAIQTFPDDFVFEGSRISQQQQVGNSVPPLFAKAIAMTIRRILDYELSKD